MLPPEAIVKSQLAIPLRAILWSMALQQQGFVLMSMAHVTIKGHVVVSDALEAMLMLEGQVELSLPFTSHHTVALLLTW